MKGMQKRTIAAMLRLRRIRHEFFGFLVFPGLIVALSTAAVLMRRGLAASNDDGIAILMLGASDGTSTRAT